MTRIQSHPEAANQAPPAPEFPWPKPHTSALMLAFDVDGESIWIAFDELSEQRLVTRSYGGYEARVGVSKVLQALDERGLKATFFLTGWVLDAHPALCESILRAGHEVAHHGYWHRRPEPDQPEKMAEELDLGFDAMKRVLGVKPVGYRAPYGENTWEGLTMLRDKGIVYSSSFRDDLRPYRHRLPDSSPGPVELPVNFNFDDFGFGITHRYMPRTLMTREHVMSIWRDELEQTRSWGGLVATAMHPQVSGRPKGFRIMTEFLDYAMQCPDLWITTGRELSAYFLEQEQKAATSPWLESNVPQCSS